MHMWLVKTKQTLGHQLALGSYKIHMAQTWEEAPPSSL
jgi:hypothetical protein